MPIYDYHCGECGTRFERLVRGSAAIACPSCASHSVERVMSLTARPASATPASAPAPGPAAGRGGCCGGGCHTHAH
ncbi:MAG TPA: zinc ribbon domain-containing protein [Gemmatimonadales bacterium]|nr:zinc ribbon domain-containing protein [Gemmatimonadales bacterium]